MVSAAAIYLASPKQTEVSKNAEKQFLEMMIPHEERAIEVSQGTINKSVSSETVELARTISTDRRAMVDHMQLWYKDWYTSDILKFGKLADAGPTTVATEIDTEEEFFSLMIPHHEESIAMAKKVEADAFHQEIKDTVASILEKHSTELKLMKQYKSQ